MYREIYLTDRQTDRTVGFGSCVPMVMLFRQQ